MEEKRREHKRERKENGGVTRERREKAKRKGKGREEKREKKWRITD